MRTLMAKGDLRSEVFEIAAEVFEAEVSDLDESTRFDEDLAATSVLLLDFLVNLERELGVPFDDREIREARDLGAVLGRVKKIVQDRAV